MKFFSFVLALTMLSMAQGWSIHFSAYKNGKTKRVDANGTKRGKCINLRSDYDWTTSSILFHPETTFYPDAKGYTAYNKANCKGSAYYGVKGQQNPKRRFRSYRVN